MERKRKHRKKYLILAAVIAILVGFVYCQNNLIQISHYTYQSEKIGDELAGTKIVQISDLHSKMFGKNGGKLIEKVEKESPNYIFLTGDFVDQNKTEMNEEFVKKIVTLCPVYYVTGNHEEGMGVEKCEEFTEKLSSLGVIVLSGDVVSLGNNCHIIGVSDEQINRKQSKITESIAKIKSDKKISPDNLSILLAHEPQLFDAYVEADVDLVFSGHAHGGQFRVPFFDIGLVAPGQGFLPKYTAGEYKQDNTTMYVSRGLGNSIIPVRIFNQPELVVVELVK